MPAVHSVLMAQRIPVIYDTDIGGDIDDTWALALLLASPELDLKLVVTDSLDTRGKAKITAKFLEQVGRTDVPIGIGRPMEGSAGAQMDWARDYDLSSYPGKIYEDGVQALINFIMKNDRETVLLVVGPAPNIEAALQREPGIVNKARVVAMSGSVDTGYNGKSTPDPEYNVRAHPSSTRAMYAAGWDVLIAPLDTAGLVQLRGPRYSRVHSSDNPLARVLIENYRAWASRMEGEEYNPDQASSTLFDPVAVYLLLRPDSCRIEEVRLSVTDDGYTRRDPSGSRVRAALEWNDRDGFLDFVVERLARARPRPPRPQGSQR